MKVPINVPIRFEERPRLTSRSIKRNGFQLRGAIFTSSASPSPDDFGPDPSHLIGKLIEKTVSTEEPDRFFEIFGGYFYSQDASGNNVTSKVFGMALDRSEGFEISEGGSTIIMDHWINTSNSKKGLDETIFHDKAPNIGWTFIVSPKNPGTLYPRSHQPLAILGECGAISAVKFNKTLNPLTVEIDARVEVDGTMPETFEWDFGDGSPKETTSVPNCAHTYERPLGDEKTFLMKVDAGGPGGCSSQGETDVPIEGVCPEINITDVNLRNVDLTSTEVFAKLEVKIGPANSYEWDWGDGSPKETTTEPSAKHIYERSFGGDGKRTISVVAIGPGRCSDGDDHVVIIPPPPCPEDVTLDLEMNLGSNAAEVKFTVTSINGTPDNFEWDFGDGSSKQTTTVPTVTHTYERPSGNADDFTASVNTTGPGSHCAANSSIPVKIPGTCPVISKIDYTKEDAVGASQEIHFKAIVNGGNPTSYVWDFGDGSTQTTDIPEVSHTFDIGPGTDKIRTIVLNSSGPDNCKAEASVAVDFHPIVCPLISEFGYTLMPISGNKQPVEFKLHFSGDAPNVIKWDFGDKSPTVTTSELSVIHEYEIPHGDADIFTVKVNLDGPADCAAQKELELKIGGVCPLLTKLSYALTNKDEYSETQNVDFEVFMERENGSPDSYEWDWGDGSPKETTKTAKASHVYARPFGDGTSYKVHVVTRGPESCSAQIRTEVHVDGICPTLGELTLTKDTPTPNYVSVSASVEVKTGEPTHYMWNWGDGSADVKTETPVATHEYARKPTEETYTVVVVAHGPGKCCPSASETVVIPSKPGCPSFTRINQVEKSQDKNSVTVEFSLDISGGTPDSYAWDWGDGSPVETTNTATVAHTFAKDSTRTMVYDIHVHTEGPDDCSADGQTEVVVNPQENDCPQITGLTLTCPPYQGPEFKVDGEVSYTGPKPEKFIWTWGDGAVDTTTVPEASHLYKRPQGQDRTCIVKVETEGPGTCKGKADSSFTLPKAEEKTPSIFCRIMPFLSAFFMALMLGMLIVCVAAEMLGHAADTAPVIIFTAVAFVLLAIVLILWQIQGAKLGCPPCRCSWLAVGWVAMLTGLIVTFFLLDCFTSWLIMAIIFFLLTGIAAYFWFTTCAVKTKAKTFFIYLLMSLLAATIVILFGASVLHCC